MRLTAARHQRGQGLGYRDRNMVLRGATEDRPSDSIQFRRISLPHVLLHGAARAGGQTQNAAQGETSVNFGSLRQRNL